MIPLYFVLLFYLLYQYQRHWQEHWQDRRYKLIALIRSNGIQAVEWHHRGKKIQLELTKESVAKLSRNRGIGLGNRQGIIIRHFWIEGKLHNTDTFSIQKLKFGDLCQTLSSE
jgi:hypothetical protein